MNSPAFSQEPETFTYLIAESKCTFKQKIITFKTGMTTSMYFEGDDQYLAVPEILGITQDSLFLVKRFISSENQTQSEPCARAIADLIWINWDGMPRKKVRAKRFTFRVE